MSTEFRQDLGKLVLRVAIAGLLLFHGIAKVRHGVDVIGSMLDAKGLPMFLAYGSHVGELAAPVLVIVGVFTRLSALVIAGNMAMALFVAHADHLFALGPMGGWAIELALLYLLGAVAIALLGAGRFALKP